MCVCACVRMHVHVRLRLRLRLRLRARARARARVRANGHDCSGAIYCTRGRPPTVRRHNSSDHCRLPETVHLRGDNTVAPSTGDRAGHPGRLDTTAAIYTFFDGVSFGCIFVV